MAILKYAESCLYGGLKIAQRMAYKLYHEPKVVTYYVSVSCSVEMNLKDKNCP